MKEVESGKQRTHLPYLVVYKSINLVGIKLSDEIITPDNQYFTI